MIWLVSGIAALFFFGMVLFRWLRKGYGNISGAVLGPLAVYLLLLAGEGIFLLVGASPTMVSSALHSNGGRTMAAAAVETSPFIKGNTPVQQQAVQQMQRMFPGDQRRTLSWALPYAHTGWLLLMILLLAGGVALNYSGLLARKLLAFLDRIPRKTRLLVSGGLAVLGLVFALRLFFSSYGLQLSHVAGRSVDGTAAELLGLLPGMATAREFFNHNLAGLAGLLLLLCGFLLFLGELRREPAETESREEAPESDEQDQVWKYLLECKENYGDGFDVLDGTRSGTVTAAEEAGNSPEEEQQKLALLEAYVHAAGFGSLKRYQKMILNAFLQRKNLYLATGARRDQDLLLLSCIVYTIMQQARCVIVLCSGERDAELFQKMVENCYYRYSWYETLQSHRVFDRQSLRDLNIESPSLLLISPEMLHYLLGESKTREHEYFFSTLSLLVLNELHRFHPVQLYHMPLLWGRLLSVLPEENALQLLVTSIPYANLREFIEGQLMQAESGCEGREYYGPASVKQQETVHRYSLLRLYDSGPGERMVFETLIAEIKRAERYRLLPAALIGFSEEFPEEEYKKILNRLAEDAAKEGRSGVDYSKNLILLRDQTGEFFDDGVMERVRAVFCNTDMHELPGAYFRFRRLGLLQPHIPVVFFCSTPVEEFYLHCYLRYWRIDQERYDQQRELPNKLIPEYSDPESVSRESYRQVLRCHLRCALWESRLPAQALQKKFGLHIKELLDELREEQGEAWALEQWDKRELEMRTREIYDFDFFAYHPGSGYRLLDNQGKLLGYAGGDYVRIEYQAALDNELRSAYRRVFDSQVFGLSRIDDQLQEIYFHPAGWERGRYAFLLRSTKVIDEDRKALAAGGNWQKVQIGFGSNTDGAFEYSVRTITVESRVSGLRLIREFAGLGDDRRSTEICSGSEPEADQVEVNAVLLRPAAAGDQQQERWFHLFSHLLRILLPWVVELRDAEFETVWWEEDGVEYLALIDYANVSFPEMQLIKDHLLIEVSATLMHGIAVTAEGLSAESALCGRQREYLNRLFQLSRKKPATEAEEIRFGAADYLALADRLHRYLHVEESGRSLTWLLLEELRRLAAGGNWNRPEEPAAASGADVEAETPPGDESAAGPQGDSAVAADADSVTDTDSHADQPAGRSGYEPPAGGQGGELPPAGGGESGSFTPEKPVEENVDSGSGAGQGFRSDRLRRALRRLRRRRNSGNTVRSSRNSGEVSDESQRSD